MSDFRKEIKFEPGYNYLHETGPKRRGQHGMTIRFLLHGSKGSTVFALGTSWTPPGQVDADKTRENGYHSEAIHCDRWELTEIGGLMAPVRFGYTRPPSGYDLGYHWRTPLYEGQEEYVRDNCEFLDGDQCYYDGSGLQANEVLADFIVEGDEAVWRWLHERYQWCLDAEAEYEAEKVDRG